MMCVRALILTASLALMNAGDLRAHADVCRDDLNLEREGMIDIRTPMRVEAVSTREALGLLGTRGELSSTLNFQRKVSDFWRRKVKRDVEPFDLIVTYKIVGGGDRTGVAAHLDDSSAQFPIRLIPSTPEILCEDTEYRIVSGGFTLLGRAANIGLAGLYALEIDVDVEER